MKEGETGLIFVTFIWIASSSFLKEASLFIDFLENCFLQQGKSVKKKKEKKRCVSNLN